MLIPAVNNKDHILGFPETGSVVLVEYGRFDCPECYSAYFLIKDIHRYLGNRLVYIFRQFPSRDEQSISFRAAEAAEAAASQGWFWEMHDYLFEHQHQLDNAHLELYAEILHLNSQKFCEELKTRKHTQTVRNSLVRGVLSGVRQEPTFFINGSRYDGSLELDDLLCSIETTGCFVEKSKFINPL